VIISLEDTPKNVRGVFTSRGKMPNYLVALCVALMLMGCDGEDRPFDADLPDGDEPGDADGDGEPPWVCESDEECVDELFCNGAERCAPLVLEADDRGCLPGEPPCLTAEACDESSDRCDDEGCPDADEDGHFDVSCGGDDCDDDDPGRFPGNPEVCDDADQDEDCNSATFGFRDLDRDFFGDGACCNLNAEGGRICGEDCDDSDLTVNPDGVEVCDGADNDCDGEIDEGVTETYWIDADGDGHGSSAPGAETTHACHLPAGYSDRHDDCVDSEAMIYPGAPELCDGRDNPCADGGRPRLSEDRDGDGFAPSGTLLCDGGPFPKTDCDDTQAEAHPGQTGYFEPSCPPDHRPLTGISDLCCQDAFWPGGPFVPRFYDFNCDGETEPEPSVSGECRFDAGTSTCEGSGPIYEDGLRPGASVDYVICTPSGGGCEASHETLPIGSR
jgi:hypothetical protein